MRPYTTLHHPDTQANVVTTDYSDQSHQLPGTRASAVQVTPSNGPTDRQGALRRAGLHYRRSRHRGAHTDPDDHIHASTTDRLVYMANQMATFFMAQPHDAAVAGVADHIKKFWDPRTAI